MLYKLAEELKNARIASNITLHQLAVKTRLDIKLIEAMEAGDFSFLPEVYVKAFVKNYARTVGLDEDLMAKKYDLYKEGKYYDEPVKEEAKTEIEVPRTKIPEVKHEKPKKSPPSFNAVNPSSAMESSSEPLINSKLLLYGGAAVVLILLLSYFLFFKNNTEIIVPEKPFESIVEEEDKPRFEENIVPEENIYTNIGDSLKLLIKAADTSWMRIVIDKIDTNEFTLFPNSTKLISAKNYYYMVIGNASSIQLQLNDKQLNFKGSNKSVQRISIDSTGITYLDKPAGGNAGQ